MINANWSRWIRASCRKHFDDRKQTVHLFFEGDDRDTTDLKEHAEFRINGPDIAQPSRNYFVFDVHINILVKTNMNSENIDNDIVICGIIQAAFTEQIEVLKLGTGPDDDQSLLGCLLLRKDKDGQVTLNHYGQIDEDTRITQATIQAGYRMTLTV